MKKIYIDKNIHIYEGSLAEELILKHNDKKYLIENVGILKVDSSRWQEAQSYERKTWCDSPAKGMGTDRNEDHEKNFGGYEQLNFSLPNTPLHIIELGCGPFTNLRLMLLKMFKTINRIDLLDPLIHDYLKYTDNCAYKQGNLNGLAVNLIDTPIEEYLTLQIYDMIVMINVIEHCYDVDIIFKRILNMLAPNGLFIFHDKFLKEENVNEIHDRYYDSGHPLKMTYKYIKRILDLNFKTIYNNIYVDEHNNECVYKILKRNNEK
jgi:SAM-dependent methyltransferase